MYHNHYAGSKFVLEANEAVSLMHSPKLFAFCCDDDLNIDLSGLMTVFLENGPVQGKKSPHYVTFGPSEATNFVQKMCHSP